MQENEEARQIIKAMLDGEPPPDSISSTGDGWFLDTRETEQERARQTERERETEQARKTRRERQTDSYRARTS